MQIPVLTLQIHFNVRIQPLFYFNDLHKNQILQQKMRDKIKVTEDKIT